MKMLAKYIVLYFESELDKKPCYLRRTVDDGVIEWEYKTKDRITWQKCVENFREELKPSTLNADYKSYMRTQKLERILE